MRLPEGAGDALEAAVLAAAAPGARHMRLSDPMHAWHARYPEGLDPLPDETRLVSGALPFGYADRLARRAVHVTVLPQPERAFLRFAARIAGAGEAEARRLTGAGPEALPSGDPDRLTRALLDLPRVRERWASPTARLCAGLAWRAGPPADEAALRAALANLGRTNFLACMEDGLNGFSAYLSRLFGWPEPAEAPAPPAPLVEPDALEPATREALRGVLEVDLRLWRIVRESGLAAAA
jgi:hypothetical protein